MKEIHVAFKIHTENSGVDLTKEDGETVNFGEGGDHTVDSIAKEITRQLKNLLEQRGIKLVDAVLAHSEEDNVIDNLLTGVRLGSFNKVVSEIKLLTEPKEEAPVLGEAVVGTSEQVKENVVVSNADSASTTE